MKRNFTITLHTTLTIDFATWGLSDAEQRGGDESKKLLIDHLLDEYGLDDFDVREENGNSLFEAIAGVVRTQNETALRFFRDN